MVRSSIGQFRFALLEMRRPSLRFTCVAKDPDFYARTLQVWCWKCGRVTTHEVTFRSGGRCFLCKECGNIVVEKL